MGKHIVQNTVNLEVTEMTDLEYRNAKSRQRNLKIVGKAKVAKVAIDKIRKEEAEQPDEQTK